MSDKDKIKLCLFDCGGVIYPYSLTPFNDFVLKLSKKETPLRFKWRELMAGKISFDTFCQDVCTQIGCEYTQERRLQMDEKLHQGVGSFYAETLKSISYLKAKGVKVGILSNALPCLTDTVKNIGIDEEFIFPSYKIGLLKPDTTVFKIVQEKTGLSFQEMLFIDDKVENVKAAEKMGIKSLVFDLKTVCNKIKTVCGERDAGYISHWRCYCR